MVKNRENKVTSFMNGPLRKTTLVFSNRIVCSIKYRMDLWQYESCPGNLPFHKIAFLYLSIGGNGNGLSNQVLDFVS